MRHINCAFLRRIQNQQRLRCTSSSVRCDCGYESCQPTSTGKAKQSCTTERPVNTKQQIDYAQFVRKQTQLWFSLHTSEVTRVDAPALPPPSASASSKSLPFVLPFRNMSLASSLAFLVGTMYPRLLTPVISCTSSRILSSSRTFFSTWWSQAHSSRPGVHAIARFQKCQSHVKVLCSLCVVSTVEDSEI